MNANIEENTLTEHILERKGCPLHYWSGGPAGKPLVVFTHGLCVDHRSWDQQIPAVITNYRVLSWDVRGHGLSQPVGKPFRVPLAVEDLLSIVDQLGEETAVFVGHSNGTYILQELVFRRPERVRALVLADGTCITWNHTPFENWLVRISPDIMNLFPYETLKKSGLPYISQKKEVQDYTYQAYSMLSKRDYINLAKGMVTCMHYEAGYQISQPLLLVHGDQDKTGDIAKLAPRWAKREANCQYVIIPDARHFSVLDNSDFFNKLLIDFLAKWALG
jgi:3-oxoadipate enol-lactonase